MKIHHVTMPARDPKRVASFLAELLGAKVFPLPHPEGVLVVYAGDPTSALEVWPATLRGDVGEHHLANRELPMPEAWPHHVFVTTDASDAATILAAFAREGWKADRVHNGPPHAGFDLVRGWLENQTCIEIGGGEMRAEYEGFVRAMTARAG
jgi:catechol 2,3-dioxygenase-like lactoylglutathione lyase family enzyme